MRIVLVNTGHPAAIKGGAEAAVLDLAHRLVARGHSVALVVHHDGKAVERGLDRGVRVYALPNRNFYYGFDGAKRPGPLRLAWHALDSANFLMAAAFGKILDEEKPDVVNSHVLVGLSQLVWREADRRNVPVVHYLHEYGSMCPRGSAFRNERLCATPCLTCKGLTAPRKRLSGLVDTVIGVSRFTLQRHLDWGFFPNARAAVIPNVFQNLAFRGRKPAADGLLRLGYFGRLIPDKGAHVLLDAVQRLPREGWTLDIAGTGDDGYLAALRAKARKNVRFLGWTKAEAFFDAVDVMVLPSIWPDPQPRVTFEAFMHGVPVIGARAGGIPEEIDEGRTGWLFDANDPESLAAVLRDRLADRADRTLPANGFAERLAALDPDRVAPLYEAAFRDAAARVAGRQKNGVAPAVELVEHRQNS